LSGRAKRAVLGVRAARLVLRLFFVLRLFRVGGLLIGVGSGIAGTGIGNGDRAPGTHQQARCEHANACSEAQMRQNHDLPPG